MSILKRLILLGLPVVSACENSNKAEHEPILPPKRGERAPNDDSALQYPAESAAKPSEQRNSTIRGTGLLSDEAADVADPEALLAFVQQINGGKLSQPERTSLLRTALRSLSHAGYTDEALRYIDSNIGPGHQRAYLISGVFSGSSLPFRELVPKLDELAFKEDRNLALEGLTDRMRNGEWDALRDVLGGHYGDEIDSSVGAAIALKFANALRTIPMPITELQALMRSPGVTPPLIDGMLNYACPELVDALWAPYSENRIVWSPEQSDRYIELMARSDPSQALRRVAGIEGDQKREVEIVMRTWLNSDSDAAARAITDRSVSLSEAARDVAILEIVRYSASFGETGAGEAWLAEIRNPDLKAAGENLLK